MIEFIKEIAVKAGDIVVQSKRTVTDRKGSHGDVVTLADSKSNTFLISSIRKHFPGHSVISEETHNSGNIMSGHVWIIDPLDGTTNFSCHIPFYCINIAHAINGEVVCAVTYDPEHNELFWSEKGKGAYVNSSKIYVQHPGTDSMVNIGCPYALGNFRKTYPYGERVFSEGFRVVNYGSAGLECAYVACGRLAGYIEKGVKPWDIAPGKLLIEEAGGKITDYRGTPWTLTTDEIVASQKTIHDTLLSVVS